MAANASLADAGRGKAEPGKGSFTFAAHIGAMGWVRSLIMLLFAGLPLCGCGMPAELLATGSIAAVIGTITAFGRSPADLVVSLVKGKDCSIVRMDEGKSYCKPTEPPPPQQPFCTRSLGAVNCWSDPAALQDEPTQVADGPMTLSPAQEENRTQRWP